MTESWDALDVLQPHAGESGFHDRWRGFLRACSLLLLPGLPPEAQEWVSAADDFDQGRLRIDGLIAARVRAWEFHDARRDSSSQVELSGIRVVMWRLWPPDKGDRWDESAWHFLDFCNEAGLQETQLWPLLRAQFPDILGDEKG
jgi:hypothetical protein